MIAGNLDVYDVVIAKYVTAAGVPFLSVDYRQAPEAGALPHRRRSLRAILGWGWHARS